MAAQNALLDAWRSALQQWETETNKLLNEVTASEEGAKALNGALSGAVQMQAAFTGTMEKALATFNLPSRDDVLKLSEQIGQVERKLDRLLAERDRSSAGPGPARTRQPPRRESGND